MPEFRLKSTGELISVAPEHVAQAIASGQVEVPAGMQAQIATSAGLADVPLEQLGTYQANYGDRLATTAEVGAAERATFVENQHGGVGGAVGTFVEQGLNEATFGLTGFLGEQVLGEDYRQNMEYRAEASPTAATVGGVAGVVGASVASLGTGAAAKVAGATAAGLSSRAGAAIAAKGVGKGIFAETAAAMAGAGVEGALLGSGHVLAETVLHDKELSGEAFVAGAGQGALWGASTGGAASLLSQGTRWGKAAYDKAQTKAADIKTLTAEQKALAKAADADAKNLARLKLDQEKHINRMGLEEAKQKGRIELVQAKAGVRGEEIAATAETKLKLADKALEKEIAKAEAKVIASRAKLSESSERLAAEEAKTARAKLIMDKRLEMADIYTSSHRRSAQSREAVAASKLEAATVGAESRTTVGLADALVKSGNPSAGTLIEDMVTARARSPKAIATAKADVGIQVERLQATTDRLIAQADEIIAVNPAAAEDLLAFRQAAAESGPAAQAWVQKSAEGTDDFATGFKTIRGAEQAQHDLAQAIRMQADGMPTPELDAITKGMDDAVGKTDEITEAALARQIKAVSDNPPAANGNAVDALGVVDTLAMVGGLPNADDIPVIGPVLGAYLKFRAAHGVLGKFGIRIPGPVGRIASVGAGVQNKASEVVALAIQKAPAVAKGIERAAPSLTSTLSRPLWEPLDSDGDDSPAGHYMRRVEELDRALGDPEGTRQKIMDSIPAPPSVAAAIADTAMRSFEYLQTLTSTDPRAPTIGGKPARPNRVEINTLAEAKRAVENPIESIKDFIEGIAGPAVIEAVRTVFPRLYQSMREEMVEKMAEVGDVVPFPRLCRAALCFDLPLTNNTTPRYSASRQAEYAMAKQAAPQPSPGGAQLRLSKPEELGSMTRAMR